jgi:hypothetical protein
MTKKSKRSQKAAKHSKRPDVAAEPEEEPDTAITYSPAEVPESVSVGPQTEAAEVPVESQQATEVAAPATQVTDSEAAPKATRTDAAKANIKQGLKQHALAGRPTKAQLILVFGTKGYAMTWPQRTARYGITPETFQAALAKGVPAIRLGPGAQTVVEKAKETA